MLRKSNIKRDKTIFGKKKTVLLLLQRFKTERQAPVSELLAILQFRTMTVVQINLLGCLRHRKVYFKRL